MNKIGGSKVQKILGAVVVTIMVVFAVTFLSCTAEREKKIDLSDVPQEVIDAVENGRNHTRYPSPAQSLFVLVPRSRSVVVGRAAAGCREAGSTIRRGYRRDGQTSGNCEHARLRNGRDGGAGLGSWREVAQDIRNSPGGDGGY